MKNQECEVVYEEQAPMVVYALAILCVLGIVRGVVGLVL